MKQILFLFFVLPVIGFSQKYIVTPYGLKSATDTILTYVILNIDGMSANALYNKANKYIQQTFKNPDYVIKGKIENEYLRYDVYAPRIFNFKIKKQLFPINTNYTVALQFKDGKLKYELMDVKLIAENDVPLLWEKTGSAWLGFSRQHIFDTNGTVEHPEEKISIENYFNTQIQELIAYLRNNKENW